MPTLPPEEAADYDCSNLVRAVIACPDDAPAHHALADRLEELGQADLAADARAGSWPGQTGRGEEVLAWQLARNHHYTHLPLVRFSSGGMRAVVRDMLDVWPEPTRWGHFPEIDRAGRWLVREVLRLPLFAGLRFTRQCEISREHAMHMPDGMTLEKVLTSCRIHPDRPYDHVTDDDGRHVFTQKLTAPDLIWVDAPGE